MENFVFDLNTKLAIVYYNRGGGFQGERDLDSQPCIQTKQPCTHTD